MAKTRGFTLPVSFHRRSGSSVVHGPPRRDHVSSAEVAHHGKIAKRCGKSSDTELTPSWNRGGTELEPSWNRVGTELEPSWDRVGTGIKHDGAVFTFKDLFRRSGQFDGYTTEETYENGVDFQERFVIQTRHARPGRYRRTVERLVDVGTVRFCRGVLELRRARCAPTVDGRLLHPSVRPSS